MAKKSFRRGSILPADFSQWNFVIFLTLAFILLVIVALSLKQVSLDLRTRAMGCEVITTLPRQSDCANGKWVYTQDPGNAACMKFVCETR